MKTNNSNETFVSEFPSLTIDIKLGLQLYFGNLFSPYFHFKQNVISNNISIYLTNKTINSTCTRFECCLGIFCHFLSQSVDVFDNNT